MADATAALISSVFMAKLLDSGLYGEPQDGLADRLKERAPEKLTEAGLLAAAERIIRHRNSGAFPKFPECLAAIEATRAVRTIEHTGNARSPEITDPASFWKACEDLFKRGHRPFLLKRENTMLWLEWRAYYQSIGFKKSVELMDEPSRQLWTTPTELVRHFDPHWVTPVTLTEPKRRNEMSAAEREKINGLFARAADALKKPGERWHRMTKEDWAAALEAATEDYRNQPVQLSEAAIKAIERRA